MTESSGYKAPAIAGSGTIATGLAANASILGEVHLLARSDASAWRAEEGIQKLCAKLEGADPERVKVTTDQSALAGCDLVVEAIVEELEPKAELLRSLADACPEADLASTTSSLSIGAIADAIGQGERFYGLHVFNPVTRMKLIELVLPDAVSDEVKGRARAFCDGLGKTAVEVPDTAGFVVNRLLFPYAFDAVRVMEETGLDAEAVDTCMKLGAGHPLGPLALLDLVGLDVSKAIGESLHEASGNPAHEPPAKLTELIEQGRLGRKAKAGFYDY